MDKSKSSEAFERAKKSLAGGVASSARLAHQPFFVSHGLGSHIYDLDGNEFIDYVLAYGPLLLGHAPPTVMAAVKEQLSRGTMFGTGFEQEYLLSEEVASAVPCADLVRFTNSGTEALHFVLRLARAYTGREKIIKFEGHYHGWLDETFISVNSKSPMGLSHSPWKKRELAGQPENAADNLIILPWNEPDIIAQTLKNQSNDIAAIICEPVPFYHGAILPQKGFLKKLRDLTEMYGVVLIFDEVVTGFRLSLGGAQEYFSVTPDLCAFAKGFAAGLPIAGFAGRRKIMDLVADNSVPHMGTYNANPLSVAGALAALKELGRDGAKAVKRMNKLGMRLKNGFNRIFKETGHPFTAIGCESIFTIISPIIDPKNYRDTLGYDFEKMAWFHRLMFDQGIWFMGRGNVMVSAAHTDSDIERTLEAAQQVLSP